MSEIEKHNLVLLHEITGGSAVMWPGLRERLRMLNPVHAGRYFKDFRRCSAQFPAVWSGIDMSSHAISAFAKLDPVPSRETTHQLVPTA